MRIWVVIESSWNGESDVNNVTCVFTSREKAEAYVKRMREVAGGYAFARYEIEEFTADIYE